MPDTEPGPDHRADRAAAAPPAPLDLAALLQAINSVSVSVNHSVNALRSEVCLALSKVEGIPTQIEDVSNRLAVIEARPEPPAPQDFEAKFAAVYATIDGANPMQYMATPRFAISKDSVADPCRIRVKGFRSHLFRVHLFPHFTSTFEMPELTEFKADAKFIMNPGPQNNNSIIFPSPQKASGFFTAVRRTDPDQRLWVDPSTQDRRRVKFDRDESL
jgi:hypothetical protein